MGVFGGGGVFLVPPKRPFWVFLAFLGAGKVIFGHFIFLVIFQLKFPLKPKFFWGGPSNWASTKTKVEDKFVAISYPKTPQRIHFFVKIYACANDLLLTLFLDNPVDVLKMFAGFFQDVFRMLRWVMWASSNSMTPSYWWSIGSIDFDNPKVYGDTSNTDGLVFLITYA